MSIEISPSEFEKKYKFKLKHIDIFIKNVKIDVTKYCFVNIGEHIIDYN